VLAIKRILPALAADEEFVKRFIEEAKLAVELSHANIVQVFDFGRFGGSLYIAMEYVDGTDLATLLRAAERKQREVPLGTGLYIAIEISKALDYAHRKTDAEGVPRGIVHRDVSPSNVLVSYEGEVKLADFGIATAAAAADTERRIMGKWRYMSPEQTAGQPLGPSSDLFSAGTVFYELFTGKRLFPGEEIPEIVRNVREMAIPPPSSARPDLPADIDHILLRALERNPAQRYPSMKEMLADLLEMSYARTIRASPLDAATLLEDMVPHRRPSGELKRGPRPLDDILRSELGIDRHSQARLTAAEVAGASTIIKKGVDEKGLSVWDIERAPTVSAQTGMRAALGMAVLALVGLVLGAGATVLSRRSSQKVVTAPPASAPTEIVLEVKSHPPGAEVAIDGEVRLAKTPGKVSGIKRGTHRVSLRLSGHEPWEEVLTISSNTVLEPELRAAQATLRVEVEPAGADLWLDGAPAGQGSRELLVPPGPHVLRAQKKGFSEAQKSLQVGPEGALVKLRLEAEKRYGALDLFSEPWGEIYLDGKDTGKQTPQRGLRVAAGHHRLRLVNPELHASKEIEFDLDADERKLLRVPLTASAGSPR